MRSARASIDGELSSEKEWIQYYLVAERKKWKRRRVDEFNTMVEASYLKDDTRFLQEIYFDISTSDFARITEVNTDEFALGNEKDDRQVSIQISMENQSDGDRECVRTCA